MERIDVRVGLTSVESPGCQISMIFLMVKVVIIVATRPANLSVKVG